MFVNVKKRDIIERSKLVNSKGEVLIVDDDLIVLELYKEILEVEDYSVTAISDSEEALALIKSKRFDGCFRCLYA